MFLKPLPLFLVSEVEITAPVSYLTAATAKSLQSCPTLCDPIKISKFFMSHCSIWCQGCLGDSQD